MSKNSNILSDKLVEHLFNSSFKNADASIKCTDGTFKFSSELLSYYKYFRTIIDFKKKQNIQEKLEFDFGEMSKEETIFILNILYNPSFTINEDEHDFEFFCDVYTMLKQIDEKNVVDTILKTILSKINGSVNWLKNVSCIVVTLLVSQFPIG